MHAKWKEFACKFYPWRNFATVIFSLPFSFEPSIPLRRFHTPSDLRTMSSGEDSHDGLMLVKASTRISDNELMTFAEKVVTNLQLKDRLEIELGTLRAEYERISGERDQYRTERDQYERERDQYKKDRDEYDEEGDRFERELLQCDAERAKCERERDQYKSERDDLVEFQKSALKEIDVLNEKFRKVDLVAGTATLEVENLKSEIREKDGQITTLTERVRVLESEATTKDEELSTATSRISTLETEGSTKDAKIAELTSRISTLDTEGSSKGADISILEIQLGEKDAAIFLLEKKVSTQESELAKAEEEIKKRDKRFDALRSKLCAQYEREVNFYKHSIEVSRGNIQNDKKEIGVLKRRIKTIDEECTQKRRKKNPSAAKANEEEEGPSGETPEEEEDSVSSEIVEEEEESDDLFCPETLDGDEDEEDMHVETEREIEALSRELENLTHPIPPPPEDVTEEPTEVTEVVDDGAVSEVVEDEEESDDPSLSEDADCEHFNLHPHSGEALGLGLSYLLFLRHEVKALLDPYVEDGKRVFPEPKFSNWDIITYSSLRSQLCARMSGKNLTDCRMRLRTDLPAYETRVEATAALLEFKRARGTVQKALDTAKTTAVVPAGPPTAVTSIVLTRGSPRRRHPLEPRSNMQYFLKPWEFPGLSRGRERVPIPYNPFNQPTNSNDALD